MKKFLLLLLFVVTFFSVGTIEASAVVNEIVKVGIKFNNEALFSANLENEVGKGYSFGYYDDARNFVTLGETAEKKISMTAAGSIYVKSDGTYSDSAAAADRVIGGWHIQLRKVYASAAEAMEAAEAVGGYSAYIDDQFRVRVGCYTDEAAAQAALAACGLEGTVVSGSRTGVVVTVSRSTKVLFEFDCQGVRSLGVLPNGGTKKAVTWFKGYKYYGGFEYNRISDGKINVVNVLHEDDYVKGVIPYEMNGNWPLAALEAQAVCARSYIYGNIGHMRTYGFDVCNTAECQVYYGLGNSQKGPSANSDLAVDNTSGMCMYSNGKAIMAVYHASNGGATESSENVWVTAEPHLVGKMDPYEATIQIPRYEYTVTYTPEELTWVVQNSGYEIGDICNVYVSEYTPTGNVCEVTVVDTDGKTLVVRGSKARFLFYSSTYKKDVRSMRFHISGGASTEFYINDISTTVPSVNGVAVISGGGTVTNYAGEAPVVMTADGIETLTPGIPKAPEQFVITGTVDGHNVGMSQYGARAMALQGMTYQDILHFYYTNITIE